MRRLLVFGLLLIFSGALFGQKAVPGGGWKGLKEFLNRQMIYPEPLLKEGRDGKVVLQCIIAEDGTPINLRIKESSDPMLNQEARRLVSGSRWSPALKAGKTTRDTVEVKVEFDARKFQRIAEKRGWLLPDSTWDTSMHIWPPSKITAAAKPPDFITKFVGRNVSI